MKRMLWLLIAVLMLAGCAQAAVPEPPNGDLQVPPDRPGNLPQGQHPMPSGPMISQTQPATIPEIAVVQLAVDDLFSDRDYDDSYDADACRITLQGDTASCTDASVKIAPGCVTITQKGTYILSGTLDAGMVMVDTDKKAKVQLVLEDAEIHSETSAAIYVAQADKVFLTLAEGTENTLSNGGSFIPVDDSNIDAVIFSRDDLTINGGGSLQIASPAGHGIVSKDEVTITGGTIRIEANSHGITGEDCVCIDGAAVNIRCGKDAIQAQNDADTEKGFFYLANTALTCHAEDNGIRTTGTLQIGSGTLDLTCTGDALHSDTDVIVADGTVTVSTQDDGIHADNTLAVYGGSVDIVKSYEGLEAKTVLIAGGSIALVSEDDGINAAGGNDQSGFGGQHGGDRFHTGDDSCILISGGDLKVNAAGDGMDSNGGLYVTGGNILVEGPTDDGNTSLDYSGNSAITGGTLVATGSARMAQSLYPQGQGVIFLTFTGQLSGTDVTVCDREGTVLLKVSPEKAFASIVVSCPEILSGQQYLVHIGSVSQAMEVSAQ